MMDFFQDLFFTLGINPGYGVMAPDAVDSSSGNGTTLKDHARQWLLENCPPYWNLYRYTHASPYGGGWKKEILRFSRKNDAVLFIVGFSGTFVKPPTDATK